MTEHGAEREDCVEEKLAGNNNVAGEEEGVESGGLTRGERSLIRRFSEALRFADFMALLMVAATAFSAFATWRTAQVTNLLFSIAERPYIGVQRTTFDSIGADAARVTIDFRNFGQVSATDGVATIRLLVDGTPLERGTAATINVGMVSPTVPHLYSSYIPADIYLENSGWKGAAGGADQHHLSRPGRAPVLLARVEYLPPSGERLRPERRQRQVQRRDVLSLKTHRLVA